MFYWKSGRREGVQEGACATPPGAHVYVVSISSKGGSFKFCQASSQKDNREQKE